MVRIERRRIRLEKGKILSASLFCSSMPNEDLLVSLFPIVDRRRRNIARREVADQQILPQKLGRGAEIPKEVVDRRHSGQRPEVEVGEDLDGDVVRKREDRSFVVASGQRKAFVEDVVDDRIQERYAESAEIAVHVGGGGVC